VKGKLEACGLIEDRKAMRAGKNMDLKRASFFANVKGEN
jgi:hypothetical protein